MSQILYATAFTGRSATADQPNTSYRSVDSCPLPLVANIVKKLTIFSISSTVALLPCLLCLGADRTTATEPDLDDKKIATFSICAADPESGTCGAAVASLYPSVGRVVPYIRAGVGAFCTQHYHVPAWGEQALDLLAAGKSPQAVLAQLLDADDQPGLRQLGIVSQSGRTANHNPTDASEKSRWWGAAAGRYYSCQGNTLTGREVIVAMSEAYEETEGSLADRLMAALVAGDRAGGDHRGRLAAGIRVAKQGTRGYWLELYVDKSDNATIDLLRKYAESGHEAKGGWRGGQLPALVP